MISKTAHQIQLVYAINLALTLHDIQEDKGGQLYIFHPLRIMLKCETFDQKIVAILHDVVEDCIPDGKQDIFYSSLYVNGISEEVINAIRAITKNKEETNKQYWARVKANPLATYVKLIDMEDNSSVERISCLPYAKQEYLTNKYAEMKEFFNA